MVKANVEKHRASLRCRATEQMIVDVLTNDELPGNRNFAIKVVGSPLSRTKHGKSPL